MRPVFVLLGILLCCFLSAQQAEATDTNTGFRSEASTSSLAHGFRRVGPQLKLDDGGIMVIGAITSVVVCYAGMIIAVCVFSRRKRFSQQRRKESPLRRSIFCVLLAASRGRCVQRLNELICLVSTLLCVHVYLQSMQPDFLAMAVEEWRDGLPSLQPLFILSCIVVSAAVALLFVGVEVIFANVSNGAGKVDASASGCTKIIRKTPGVKKSGDIISPTSSRKHLLDRMDVVNEHGRRDVNRNNNRGDGDVSSSSPRLLSRLFSPAKPAKVLRVEKLTAAQIADLVGIIETYRPTSVVMRRNKKIESFDSATALDLLNAATPTNAPNKVLLLPPSELPQSVLAKDKARVAAEVKEFSEALMRNMLQHLSAASEDQKKDGASKAEEWAERIVNMLNTIQVPRGQKEEDKSNKADNLIAELADAVAEQQRRSTFEEAAETENQTDAVTTTDAASALPQLLKRKSCIRRESSILTVRRKAESQLDVQTIRVTNKLQKKLKLAASVPAGVGISQSSPSAGIDNAVMRPAAVMEELQRFVGDVVNDDVHTFARSLVSIMTEVLTRQLTPKDVRARTLGATIKGIFSKTSLKKSTSKTHGSEAPGPRPLFTSDILFGREVAKHVSSCILKKKSTSTPIEQDVKVRALASSYVQAIVDRCVEKVANEKDETAASTGEDTNTTSSEGMQLESLYLSGKVANAGANMAANDEQLWSFCSAYINMILQQCLLSNDGDVPRQEAASIAASAGGKQQNEGQHFQAEREGNVEGFRRGEDDHTSSDDDAADGNNRQQRGHDENTIPAASTAAPPHVVIQIEDDEDDSQNDADSEYSGSLPAVVGKLMNVLLVLTTAAALSFSLVYGIGLDDKAGLLVIAGLGFGLLQQVFLHEPLKILTLLCFHSKA